MISRLLHVIAIVGALVACSNKLSMADCQKDAECSGAYTLVVSANQTVANVCPRDPKQTNPGCENAMATLNTAEAGIFPRLKDEDAQLLGASLLAGR